MPSFKSTFYLAVLTATSFQSVHAQVIGCAAGQIGVGAIHSIFSVGDIWSALDSACDQTLIDQVIATPPTPIFCGTGTHGTVVNCDASGNVLNVTATDGRVWNSCTAATSGCTNSAEFGTGQVKFCCSPA